MTDRDADKVVPLKPGTGTDGVAAMTAAAKRKAAAQKRNAPEDPPIGQGFRINGEVVPPGGWLADRDGYAPGCPVAVLGKNGETIYLTDSLGQLRPLSADQLSQKKVQDLVGNRQAWLYWAFPGYDKSGKLVRWRNEQFVEMIATVAHNKGLWDAPDRVRGLGAWLDNNLNLLYHAGNEIHVAGRSEPIPAGEIDGFFYPRRPDIPPPYENKITAKTNPALDIFRTLQTWQWERPNTDPFLLLGAVGAGFLGGALPWRPTTFLVGDRAVGKSTLQHLLKDIYERAVHNTADTSPAGIYQKVGYDSLPVAVDELEAEADNRRTQGVFRLARLAASGGRMFRGGADHTGVEFTARNCFFFSAINPPPLPAQDLSRMIVLNLRKLPPERAAQSVERLSSTVTGQMLLRRLMDEWHRFQPTFQAYRETLAKAGHDGRGQDTYGIALTCADLLLGPELLEDLGYPSEDLSQWQEHLAISKLPELADAKENWLACLTHLLGSRVEAWREGRRRTVGHLLEDMSLKAGDEDYLEFKYARGWLYQAGLSVIDMRGKGLGFWLAIPSTGPLVAALFKDQVWGGQGAVGVWTSALRQGPDDVVLTAAKVREAVPGKTAQNWNLVKVNGVTARCTLISIDGFRKRTEG